MKKTNCKVIKHIERNDWQDYLMHSFMKKRKNHKYIMRIMDGVKARYFYTMEQLEAYRNRNRNDNDRIKRPAHSVVKTRQVKTLKGDKRLIGGNSRRSQEQRTFLGKLFDKLKHNRLINKAIDAISKRRHGKEDAEKQKEYEKEYKKRKKEHKYVTRIKTSYGYRYFYSENEFNAYLRNNDPTLRKLEHQKKQLTPEKDAEKVNPNFDNDPMSGWSNNCAQCTTTYDLRRRGFDVTAPYAFGMTFEQIDSCYEDSSKNWDVVGITPGEEDTYLDCGRRKRKELDRIVQKYPEGARGNLCVYWDPDITTGGGHSMVWEKRDGHFMIRDTQSGEVFKTKKDLDEKLAYTANWGEDEPTLYLLRTDDLKPTKKVYKYTSYKKSKKRK